jgi:hypothetical protein
MKMNQTKARYVGLLLLSGAVWSFACLAVAQSWQPAAKDNPVEQSDWQQRVLKKSEWKQPSAAEAEAPRAKAEQTPNKSLRWYSDHDATAKDNESDGVILASTYPTRQSSARPYTSYPYSQSYSSRQPRMAYQPRARFVSDAPPEEIPPGSTNFEPMAEEGVFSGQAPGGCAGCGRGDGSVFGDYGDCGGYGDCGDCGECCPTNCGPCCDFGWEVFDGRCGPLFRGISIFAGADAFKNSADYGRNGNFGFNEGINMARPLGDPWGCGYQIGANFVQSDFSGTQRFTVADQYRLYAATRRQYFATAGLFRWADCRGFQGGVAFDYLHDIYFETSDLKQIRSETSYLFEGGWELGYYGAYGLDKDRTIDGRLESYDMFVLYTRRYFENGGNGRIWGGATGQGDGLIGAEVWSPLGRGFALESRVNYLIPKGSRDEAQGREGWGLVIQLVWYPGHDAICQRQNPYRPMFNVADNSLLMVDRLEGH